MTGERAAAWVLTWCDLYTRGLPADVAADRRAELESDLHDHRLTSWGQTRSTFRRDVVVRAVLGMPADLSWRTHQRRTARSAREPEAGMTARTPLDTWTRTAYVVGAIITAWSATLGIGLLLDARNVEAGSEDFMWRIWMGSAGILMLALSIHGLTGIRSHPTRAASEFALAALVTTFWMLWAWQVLLAGVAAMVFFAAYAVHRRAQRSGAAAPA